MNKNVFVIFISVFVVLMIAMVFVLVYMESNSNKIEPETIFLSYIEHLKNSEYESMYEFIDDGTKNSITEEYFITRNKNIYSGIEAENIQITNLEKLEERDRNSYTKI